MRDFTSDRTERKGKGWCMRRKLRTLKEVYSTDTARLIVLSFVVASMLLLTVANVVDKVMWLKIIFLD